MECKGILVSVGGGVVGLAGVSGDAYEGGEHDEEIHVLWKRGVQVPTSLDFRRDNCMPVFGGHVFERRVAKVHRALNDAADGVEIGIAGGDGLLQLASIANIALIYADLDVLSSKIVHERSGVWVVSS